MYGLSNVAINVQILAPCMSPYAFYFCSKYCTHMCLTTSQHCKEYNV